jgi:DNA-binding CsgD family transcriptional regulator
MSLAIQGLGFASVLRAIVTCDHFIITAGHNSVGSTPRPMTPRQKMAVMLRKAHYTDSQIAEKMGISRENANRLVNRGLRAERAILQHAASVIGNQL